MCSMYTRSIANKLNLLTMLYDHECETHKELTKLELGDPLGYIADAKRLKNIYRIKILNLHVKSLLATGRTIRAFNSTTNMIIMPTR